MSVNPAQHQHPSAIKRPNGQLIGDQTSHGTFLKYHSGVFLLPQALRYYPHLIPPILAARPSLSFVKAEAQRSPGAGEEKSLGLNTGLAAEPKLSLSASRVQKWVQTGRSLKRKGEVW